MPRTTPSSPTYKTHTCHGDLYAYTRIDGRRISLGRARTPEVLTKYRRILSEWEAAHAERELAEPSRLTVSELAERFVEHQTRRIQEGQIHPKNGYLVGYAAQALVEESRHAVIPANRFGPKALREIQRRLAKTPTRISAGCYRDSAEPPCLSRSEVNRRMNMIRQMFRWAVSEELVPPSVLQSLEAVSGLRTNEARDTQDRTSADPEAVSATVDALRRVGSYHIADIIVLIRWTGCRPSEICGLTAGEVCETPDGMELHIQEHKSRKHTNAARVVSLNDRAKAIVQAAVDQGRSIDPGRHLFTNDAGKPITQSGLYQAGAGPPGCGQGRRGGTARGERPAES